MLPSGDGGFVIKPGKPVGECPSRQAAAILGISRSSLSPLVNQPLAAKIIRWRWTSPRQGKRMFDMGSLQRYREATRDPEFGSLPESLAPDRGAQ